MSLIRAVSRIAVSQQMAWCHIEWKRLDELLGPSRGCRVLGDIRVKHATAPMAQHDQNE
jgi:hypothetical protein